jgi:anti-sigma factor RsiW
MSEHRRAPFEESLLSGYLDGELTQADSQRVRLRLESDPEARALYEEMRRIREAARSTRLPVPADEEWNEAPRSAGSRWLRGSGWLVVVGVALAVSGLGAWALLTGDQAWWQTALALGVVAGPCLLLGSALVDRLKVAERDRYRRVEK